MFDYLVSSSARRRLLELLWAEGARGSAVELAGQAFVSFPTCYRELRSMLRHGLVSASHLDGVAVYQANGDHPLADVMRRLVTPPRDDPATTDAADDEVRAQLAAHGAPVRSGAPVRDPSASVEEVVVAGAALARRDPATARALPVLLHRVAEQLDETALGGLARARGVAHVLGFLLSLSAHLGGRRRLGTLARSLRDHRVRDQAFFLLPPGASEARFALARRWGLRMTMDEESFASTFRRFVPESRA